MHTLEFYLPFKMQNKHHPAMTSPGWKWSLSSPVPTWGRILSFFHRALSSKYNAVLRILSASLDLTSCLTWIHTGMRYTLWLKPLQPSPTLALTSWNCKFWDTSRVEKLGCLLEDGPSLHFNRDWWCYPGKKDWAQRSWRIPNEM